MFERHAMLPKKRLVYTPDLAQQYEIVMVTYLVPIHVNSGLLTQLLKMNNSRFFLLRIINSPKVY